jgi:hypothetical protein
MMIKGTTVINRGWWECCVGGGGGWRREWRRRSWAESMDHRAPNSTMPEPGDVCYSACPKAKWRVSSCAAGPRHTCMRAACTYVLPQKKAGLGFKKGRSACLVKPATPPAAPLFARRHKKEGRRPAVSTAALHRLRDLGLDAITQQHRNIQVARVGRVCCSLQTVETAARTCTRAPCRC